MTPLYNNHKNVIKHIFIRYEINGNYPNGHGKLNFLKQSENTKNCVQLIDSILGLPPPDIIESDFIDGFISGIVNLTWVERNIQMTAYTQNGQLHGMFKVHDKIQNRWMIGAFNQNKLKDNYCWLIENQMVTVLKYIAEPRISYDKLGISVSYLVFKN